MSVSNLVPFSLDKVGTWDKDVWQHYRESTCHYHLDKDSGNSSHTEVHPSMDSLVNK